MRLFRIAAANRAVHFLALGAVIFALAPRRTDPSKVVVSNRDLEVLHAAQAAKLGVASLSAAQIAEVDARAIEDDVLYREAVRLGLDRGDVVVRQHLVQKMLLLAEDTAGATRTPTEEELRAFYAATRSRWTRDASVHFIHVFGNRHETIAALARDVREADARAGAPPTPPLVGDAFPASRDVTSGRAGVAAVYGEAFAAAVFAQAAGAWGEPLESKLGWHLVKVLAHDDGHPASYEEVREALALEWAIDKRHAAVAAFLGHAFDRYDVRIDGVRSVRAASLPRLAQRLDPSGED